MIGSFPIGTRALAETKANALVLGRVNAAGYAPSVGSMAKVLLPCGSVEASGYAPVVALDTSISLLKGEVKAAGYEPVVALGVTLTPPCGSVEAEGYEPTVIQYTLYSPFISSVAGIEAMLERATAEGLNVSPELEFLNLAYGSYDYLIQLADDYAFEGAVVTIREVYKRPDSGYYTDLEQARAKRMVEPIYLVNIELHGGALVLNFSDREVLVPDSAATDVVFKGAIDSLISVGLDVFSYKLSRLINLSDRRWKQSVLSTTDFPTAEEDVGKYLPIIYGSGIKLPALRATWGARSTLKTEITDSATSMELSDASTFPSFGNLIIDDEHLSYSGKSGNTLTGVSRGLNGTTKAAHSANVDVIERLAQYISVLADHELHSVSEIYAEIDNKLYRVDSGVAYYYQGGKALLVASENVQVSSGGDAEVIDPTHDHGSQETSQYTISTLPNKTLITNSSTGAYSTSMYFNDVGGVRNSVTYKINVELYLKDLLGGTRVYNDQMISVSLSDASGNIVTVGYIEYPSTSQGTMQIQFTVTPTSFGYQGLYGNRIRLAVASVDEKDPFGGSSYFTVTSCDRIVSGETEAATTGIQVNVTASTSSVERFVAVVNGYKDPDGNYGGLGAVIENPAHIIKHFLVRRLGYSLSKDINSSAFAAAASALSSYKLGFAVREEVTPSKFITELAWSSGATAFSRAGQWRVDKVPSSAPAAVKAIDNSQLVDQKPGFMFGRQGIFDIINSVDIRYKRAYCYTSNESEWEKTYSHSNAASISKYGIYHTDLDLKWVRDDYTAQQLAIRYVLERKLPLWTVEMTLPYEDFDLAPGDTIGITGPLNNGKKFYIQEIYRQDKGKFKLRAIEWYA